jgi:hypothetical protein
MTNSFVFYRSFYEAISDLELTDKIAIYEAMADYALNDTEHDLIGIQATIWKLIKPQIDSNKKRREDGNKGGRPKKEYENGNVDKKPVVINNENQWLQNEKPNVNDNVNVNVNKNVNENANEQPSLNDLKAKYLPNKEFGIEVYKNETPNAQFYNEQLFRVNNRMPTHEEIADFNSQLKLIDKVHDNFKDYCGHFRNWLTTKPNKKQEEKLEVDINGKPRPSSQHRLWGGKWIVE